MSIIIDYLVIFTDDQFNQVNMNGQIIDGKFTRLYWRTGQSGVQNNTQHRVQCAFLETFHTPDMSGEGLHV